LPHEDFDTLESGEIFLGRTTYFELLSALPKETRNRYRAEVLTTSSFFEFGQQTFDDKLRHLIEFITTRVLAVGELLRQIDSITSELELRDERGRVYSHQFFPGDESERGGPSQRGNDVHRQAALFQNLNVLLEDFATISEQVSSEEVPQKRSTLSIVMEEIRTRDRLLRETDFESLFEGHRDEL
jgi:hypothetical protein